MKKIKKCLVLSLVALVAMFMAGTNSSATFLNDWYLDIDGGPGGFEPFQINEFMDIVGPSYIINTFEEGETAGTFEEFGALQSSSADGGTLFPWVPNYELTGLFYGFGDVDLEAGTVVFNGGELEVYSDSTPDFGTNAGDDVIYGANNGTHIGSFNVKSGLGQVNPTGIPNGQLTISFESTFLQPGFWFDSGINDLSDLDPISFLLGFSTTNASYVENPSPILVSELGNKFAGVADPANNPPDDLFISANGQYRLQVIPEPGTLILLGLGLLGITGYGRRKL